MSEVRTTGQVLRLGTGNLNDFVKVACLVATQRHLGFGQSHIQSETDIAEGNYGGKLWKEVLPRRFFFSRFELEKLRTMEDESVQLYVVIVPYLAQTISPVLMPSAIRRSLKW